MIFQCGSPQLFQEQFSDGFHWTVFSVPPHPHLCRMQYTAQPGNYGVELISSS